MYRRADLSRAVMVAVALLPAAVSTRVAARELCAARSEDHPIVQALRYLGGPVAEPGDGSIQFKMFHSRRPGEEQETPGQTRAGAIDLDRTDAALIATLVPAVVVPAMHPEGGVN